MGWTDPNESKEEEAGSYGKLSELYDADRDDNNLAELIDTKIHLNFEIEKYEHY